MTFYSPPWNNSFEPNQGNIRQWLDNLYTKFQPLEQTRWNEANIDTLFYSGSQTYVNRYFNFNPTTSAQQYYFNIIQQPINIVTGYERQHRKNFCYIPCEGADPQTTDQYTKLVTHIANASNIHEQKSKAKELAAISGFVLAQPYLDYSDDPAQGDMKVKIWEYNSFMIDPYWRGDINEANFIWCQEYISKKEAEERFPDKIDIIGPMSGTPQRYGNFYFLPENYNMSRNDLMVLSYVWYKSKTKRKKLYSRSKNMFFDIGRNADLDAILYNIPDMELVETNVQGWKLATVLNDQLMFQGDNPLGFTKCPFAAYYWNYDPHVNMPALRVRSLVRPMRDPQFLFNYKVIVNNDIAAATINSGWKRKQGAVANEDALKKTGQGWDVVINDGYELTDCEKILPTAVPESDLNLAEQMRTLIYETSGINVENWSGQQDKQISTLTALIKQAANLLVFQKYFDQWDYADKCLGDLILQTILHNWSPEKVALIIGEEPSPFFYSGIFSKYQVLVEESDLTPTQQNLQAQQMMEMNERFGREIFPPSMIIPKLNITGKGEIIPFLQQQEQKAQAMQQETSILQQAFQDARLKELYTRAVNNISMARERNARSDSNIGLLEERLSEISKNQSLSTKAKMEALEKLIDVVGKYGEIETQLKMNEIESINLQEELREDRERQDAKVSSEANKFMMDIMQGIPKENLAQYQ